MNFAIIGFVPVDIFITLRDAAEHVEFLDDQEYVWLAYTYQILYWLLFLLTWTVIPIVSEYESAVDLDSNDRIKRSFKNNLKFYIYIAVIGIVFLAAIIMSGQAKQ
jgi:hypothetical protein